MLQLQDRIAGILIIETGRAGRVEGPGLGQTGGAAGPGIKLKGRPAAVANRAVQKPDAVPAPCGIAARQRPWPAIQSLRREEQIQGATPDRLRARAGPPDRRFHLGWLQCGQFHSAREPAIFRRHGLAPPPL